MTVTTADPSTIVEVRPGLRAARLRLPRAVDVLRELANEHGVCARPVTLRRTNLQTGETEIIDIPCGATREDKCPACARRARHLRQVQIREGWHRDSEPIQPEPATEEQRYLVELRAHLEFQRAAAEHAGRWADVADLDESIRVVEEEIAAVGLRGRVAPSHGHEDQGDGKRRVRSTRRRQDAPDLPRRKVEPRTIGRVYTAPNGKTYRPSLFLTLTLPSYGRVHTDGTPVDPATYDYRRAAWDAVHFPRLLDRFWQNLRRVVGWNVQYAGSVEPQRRLAPHAHFAVRGTIPRAVLRQVAAATYHQVWWPSVDVRRYTPDRPPVWDEERGGYVDPDTGVPLPTWDEALDAIDADPDAEPVHVVRFGEQVHAEGVLAGTQKADRLIRYVTKYITKNAADCHQITTDRQRAHLERLWEELRHTPCSDRCANWLLYGVQPRNARPKLRPGHCKGRVHQRATLGLGGRRILISRDWSGKTLADHRADARAWVRALLGVSVGVDQVDELPPDQRSAVHYAWELARPGDPDIPPVAHRLLHRISERIQQRAALAAARGLSPGAPGDVSATAPTDRTRGEEHRPWTSSC